MGVRREEAAVPGEDPRGPGAVYVYMVWQKFISYRIVSIGATQWWRLWMVE
jgi:hypothetical protein